MDRQITASILYSHLTCPHRVAMDAFADPAMRDKVSPFVQLLWERGTLYEADVMRALGTPFTDLSEFKGDAKEAATRTALGRGDPLVYAGRLSVDDLLGEPDLLRRESAGYAAIDIKSGAGKEGGDEDAGQEGKPKKHYGVQLALYTDILERLGYSAGRRGYIWDVHGAERPYDLDVPLGPKSPSIGEIYRQAQSDVQATLDRSRETLPAAASVCKLCVWRSSCLRTLKGRNDLTLLPELGRARRDSLSGQFPTVADLATANVARFSHGKTTDFKGIGVRMLTKFRARAELATMKDPVPYLTHAVDWPTAPTELFFDIETDPMRDLVYLHGFVIRENGNTAGARFEGIFAEDLSKEAEEAAFARAVAVFRKFPEAVVIHYASHEKTYYGKLQKKYPGVCRADEIESLFTRPRVLDLYHDIVQSGSEWPTMDFSVKSLAKCCGFKWRDLDPSGAASIEWFDQWTKTRDPALRQRLLDYNEDDCHAMHVVLDAMKQFPVRT